MSRSRSSVPPPADAELRLPRPPGVIRQFWARHPLATDIVLAVLCLLLALGPIISFTTYGSIDSPQSFVSSPAATIGVAALVVLGAVSLVIRRRVPMVPFAIAIAIQASFLAVPSGGGAPLLLIAAYSLAVYRSNRACWIGFGTGVGIVAVVSFTALGAGLVPDSLAWNATMSTIIFGLIGALVGVNIGNRRRWIEAVIDRSRQLVVERDQQAQLAAATERTRIAREMHDIVSHSLTVVVALAEGAMATEDGERARGAMDAAAHTARDALAEMRTMLGVLREDEGALPLTPAQPLDPRDAVVSAQRAGFPVSLAVAGQSDPPIAVRYAVGRIVQEGVTNAMRHAPTASEIRVRVEYAADRVAIEVANDGAHEHRGAGFGLRGLAERVAHVGGTVRSGPVGSGRWLLAAVLPYDTERAASASPLAGSA